MKYVMAEVRQGDSAKAVPLLFPNFLVHREMATVFRRALRRHGFEEVSFGSAGEVDFGIGGGFECSGRSETMQLEARTEDARIIELYDYLHGL